MKFKRKIGDFAASITSMFAKRISSQPFPRDLSEWRHCSCSYAQFAEDLLVLKALEAMRMSGVAYYVDVGAYHPIMFSNTVRLHWKGWPGINIDATIEHIERFRKIRPDDVNLHIAVGEVPGEARFLSYPSGTTNRLIGENEDPKSILGELPTDTRSVPVETLAAILAKHAPAHLPFGFLSIDCEGGDLAVLRSNDWERFSPWIVAVEDHGNRCRSETDEFCESVGYRLWAIANVTKIFILDPLPN